MVDEQARLNALRSAQILDTAPTEAFDRFTDLAADLFQTPIALVSLVDEHRQWFKSSKGVELTCAPRKWAFCNHTIAQGPKALMIVEDAETDERFRDNPLVTEAGIRFYAGAAITDANGYNLGTLCVIDRQPRRTPLPRKLAQLRMLADMVGAEIENVRLAAHAAAMHERVLLAADAGRMGVWEWDFQTGQLVWDERMFKLFQYRGPSAPSFEAFKDLVHPDDIEPLLGDISATTIAYEQLERDFRILTPSGEVRVMRALAQVRRDSGGAAVAMVGFVWDISDRQAKLELFENAFAHASTGEALVALDGSFMKVNPAFCALLGYSAQDLLKADFQTITHPDDLDADVAFLKELTAGKIETYGMDKRYLRADGSIVWAHLSVSMVENTDRTPRHYIAQVQDLTARRAAEGALKDSEERYRLMAENTTDVIVTTSLDGVLTFVAPSSKPLTGYDAAEFVGRTALDFAHPDDRAAMTETFRGLFGTGPHAPVRWRVAHKDSGETVWLESNPSLMRDPATGVPTGYLDVIRDVGRQVAQEEALTAARAEAETASAVKSQFLANMSHEIRTPLTAIIGFSDLLKRRGAADAAFSARCVDRIHSAGRALLSIVNDVLDFSKLEAGQFEIDARPTLIRALARETLTLFTPQAEAKGLRLAFDADETTPDWVTADPERVRQVLLNLIGNAMKFTTEGAVSLRLRYLAGERLRFEVRDTGAGMSPEQQTRLFQRFSQVDASQARKHGGTGLGLAICKGLSEAMGGGVWVESEPGVGSTFAFEISAPTAADPDAAREHPVQDNLGLSGFRVLVVDDNPINRELTRALLESVGASVADASCGAEGIEMAAAEPFDLVLLDMRMPDLNGGQVLEVIRGRPGPNRDAPILAFTAEPEFLSDATGFDGYVSKPIVAIDLFEAIVAAVEGQEQRGKSPPLEARA